MEEIFKNIEEQRRWNDESMWTQEGHEWSKSFGNTENLWNKHIFEDVKKFRGGKILEIAPGHGRITQFLSILASELLVVDLNPFLVKNNSEFLLAIAIPDVTGETAISVKVFVPNEIHVFPESAEYIKFPLCESVPYRLLPAPSRK